MLHRRLLLLSLFTLISLWRLSAQTVDVHGLVYGDNGDPVEDVNVTITAIFADSTVIFETVATGADGIYQYEFTAPANQIGWLQISMADCWGTWQAADFPIQSTPASFSQDFAYCENITVDSCVVFIIEQWNPGAAPFLEAWTPFNIGNVLYSWSNGANTSAITPEVEGEYCVTITSPTGCVASDCYTWVQDTFPDCFAFITSIPDSTNAYVLVAEGVGTAPFTYAWSNGSDQQTIIAGPGTHCVTVTDAEGCSFPTCIFIENNGFCEAYIYDDWKGNLIVTGFGVAPFTYLWSTGETGDMISPDEAGLYCVTVTDGTQCQISTCYYFTPPYDTCYVAISPVFLDSSSLSLLAYGYSFIGDSVTYLWSNGATGEIIPVDDPFQDYCVTMTAENGCTASTCFSASNFCYAWVNVNYIDPGNAMLTVYNDPIFGGQAGTYEWSNGDTTSSISVSENGTYCVTVTLGSCIAEACGYVDFDSLQYACYTWVFSYYDSAAAAWVADAYAWGFGELSYEWHNGDTTPTTTLASPNELACVTVTTSFGCETSACVDTSWNPCQVYVDVWYTNAHEAVLSAYNWGGSPGDYTWSHGESGSNITVYEEGEYCVTFIGGGCIYTACVNVTFWNVDSCSVYVATQVLPSGGAILTAYGSGVFPLSYLWSDGSTESTLHIEAGDQACVTVTDALGCVATGCGYYVDSCYAQLYYSQWPTPTIYISSWNPVDHVLWSTGETTPQLPITSPGVYCAIVWDVTGCVDSACVIVDTLNFNGINVISGFVHVDSIFAVNGTMTAYSVDPSGGPYEEVASTPFVQNYYQFNELPNGLYLVKAEIDPADPLSESFLPTYHYASVEWEDAAIHALPNLLTVTTDVWMVRAQNGGGTGIIGGVITDPNGFTADEGTHERGGEGLANVSILLSNADGTPIQHFRSNEDGTFEFNGLDFGTYRLKYDIPGLSSPEIWVTLTAQQPVRNQITLVVTQGSVDVEEPISIEVMISPNPARNEINIQVPAGTAEYDIHIVDMQGKSVRAGSVKSNNGIMHIEVGQLAPGLYHINLLSNDKSYFGRFVKQE